MVAHGLPVAISAPSVFRFTGLPGQIHDNLAAEKCSQDWRAECAMILQASTSTAASTTILSEKATRDQPGEALADELLELTNLLKVPIGIGSLGYTKTDVDALAVGTLPQHRAVKLSPRRPVELEELGGLFRDIRWLDHETVINVLISI